MDTKLMQIGSAAEGLARYISENGNSVDPDVIAGQIRLLVKRFEAFRTREMVTK